MAVFEDISDWLLILAESSIYLGDCQGWVGEWTVEAAKREAAVMAVMDSQFQA